MVRSTARLLDPRRAAALVATMSILSGTDLDNIRNMFFDADGGGDILLFIRALGVYTLLRIVCEYAYPGKVRGYTMQQYVMTLFHQAGVLPLCALGWMLGLVSEEQGPILIYVLTGAHMISDSVINYSPVSACVAGVDGKPTFSWGVHAHHLFTVVLCALGTTLPPRLVAEGALCILLGELGSLWISVTMLRPTPSNFAIRFYSFSISRAAGVLLALDIVRQVCRLGFGLARVEGGLGCGRAWMLGVERWACWGRGGLGSLMAVGFRLVWSMGESGSGSDPGFGWGLSVRSGLMVSLHTCHMHTKHACTQTRMRHIRHIRLQTD